MAMVSVCVCVCPRKEDNPSSLFLSFPVDVNYDKLRRDAEEALDVNDDGLFDGTDLQIAFHRVHLYRPQTQKHTTRSDDVFC